MKKLSLSTLVFSTLLASSFLFWGCGGKGDLVLAKVGGEKIYARELDEIFARSGQAFATFDEELDSRKTILDSLIIQKLLIQEAYKKHIDEAEDVNRIVLGNKDQFLLDVLYQKVVIDQIKVDENTIRDFYDKSEYKIQASNILVSTEDTANMIIDSLKNGSNFENLAVKYSLDPRAKINRGDLGYFVWGQMDTLILEQAFKLNPGEISKPFKTKYGWHILKVVNRAPNDLRGSYDKMKDQIKSIVESVQRSIRLEQFKIELQEKYKIRVDTITCQYLMHKRATLYPPSLLETLPKNDFDPTQLDRDEKELILASWDGGQIALGQYLVKIKNVSPNAIPNLDDYPALANFVFNLSVMEILATEARRMGIENDQKFKDKLKKFKELAMADIMENDSLPYPNEPDEGEIKQYYENHQQEFSTPEMIHVYEVMLNDYNTAETYAKKTNRLDKFKTLATQYTERSGKRTSGGDLGWIEERTYPSLYQLAQKTDIGRVGGPVAVGSKFSIIYVAEKKPVQVKDFLMVKQEIRDRLDKEKRKTFFDEWVAKKKSEVNIKTYDNNLRVGIDKAKYAAAETTTGK